MATARLVELAGLSFRVLAPDTEPKTLLIHDIGTDAGAEPSEAAAIAYDRRGYGGSSAPEGYAATTVEEQSEDAARLLEALQAPPLTVAGAGFGALIALDLARRHPARVSALRLHDPVVAQFVPDSASAVEGWMDAGTDAVVLADIGALTRWFVTRRELRAITVLTQIMIGPRAAAAVTETAEALAQVLPQASLAR